MTSPSPILPPERIGRVQGFGMATGADGYIYRPTSVDEMLEVFALARRFGRRVVLRGAGRSYGDASICPEALVLDVTRMRRILAWDPTTGIIEGEAGVTIEDLWRLTLEDGWWPPVVSGTMFPTLAGALAMNIHGKNNPQVGTIGEHILEIDLLLPNGEVRTLRPDDELLRAAIGGFGMLGVITRWRLQMKRVHSGDLHVLPLSCENWDAQFEAFERYLPTADYAVSWIDCFARGPKAGRGQFHAAWYINEPGERPASMLPQHQDLPDTALGFIPKGQVWRFLRWFNNRTGMRSINAAKQFAGKLLGNGRPHGQSLVGFSFLLDYVPDWRKAYLPGGFIQYQSFVPKSRAAEVFRRQVELQQAHKLESFLGVLKRHRPDPFLFSHGVDGYSLALDFKVTASNRDALAELAHAMNDLVVEAGGRFYFAKDSTLRPSDVVASLGDQTVETFRRLKHEVDPEGLLVSSLARRLRLTDAS